MNALSNLFATNFNGLAYVDAPGAPDAFIAGRRGARAGSASGNTRALARMGDGGTSGARRAPDSGRPIPRLDAISRHRLGFGDLADAPTIVAGRNPDSCDCGPAASGLLSGSTPLRSNRRPKLQRRDVRFLRRSALHIWRYFAEFSSEEHNWLVPGQHSGQPAKGRGQRISDECGTSSERNDKSRTSSAM